MKAKPFLIGLSTGIVGGITAIIFTTPQSGQQLRSNIIHNAKNAKNNLIEIKQQSSNVKQSVSSLKYEAQNNIPKIIMELKGSFLNFKQEIEPDTVKLKEEIDRLQKSITEIENNLSEINNTNNEKPENTHS